MFFCHEILQRRNGSFGIIWLAAMQNKSLTRREYEKVHIAKKCEEIIKYIMFKTKTSRDRTRRFSLYLSAQLMYGTVKVFLEQNKYLLTDCLEAEKKLKKVVVKDLMALPEAVLLSSRRLCLTEDFSTLTTCVLDDVNLNPLIRQSIDLLHVSVDFLREAENHLQESLDSIVHTSNTAPAHTITIPEFSINGSDVFLQAQFSQVAPELDLPPIPTEDLERFYVDPQLSPIKHVPEIESIPSHEPTMLEKEPIIETLQDLLEQTPAIAEPPRDSVEKPPSRPDKRPSSSVDDDPETGRRPARKKSKVSAALVMPPLEHVVGEERRRQTTRTRLIIDASNRIDKELWKKWQEEHAVTTRPAILPDNVDRVEDLMTQPGSQGNFNSIAMKAWFKRLCTQAAVTAVLPGAERVGPDQTGDLTAGAEASRELPRFGTSITNESGTERLLANTRSETIINRSGNISANMDTPSSVVAGKLKTSRRVAELQLSHQEPVQAATPLPDQPLPDQPVDMPNIEETIQVTEQNAIPIPEEQPLEMEQVPANMEQVPAEPVAGQLMQATTPALVIEDGRSVDRAVCLPLTPRTISVKAKLTRSLKKHFLEKDRLLFTELSDIIQANKTTRQEVAQLFHCLLTMAKRRQIEITQEEPYESIYIERGEKLIQKG